MKKLFSSLNSNLLWCFVNLCDIFSHLLVSLHKQPPPYLFSNPKSRLQPILKLISRVVHWQTTHRTSDTFKMGFWPVKPPISATRTTSVTSLAIRSATTRATSSTHVKTTIRARIATNPSVHRAISSIAKKISRALILNTWTHSATSHLTMTVVVYSPKLTQSRRRWTSHQDSDSWL